MKTKKLFPFLAILTGISVVAITFSCNPEEPTTSTYTHVNNPYYPQRLDSMISTYFGYRTGGRKYEYYYNTNGYSTDRLYFKKGASADAKWFLIDKTEFIYNRDGTVKEEINYYPSLSYDENSDSQRVDSFINSSKTEYIYDKRKNKIEEYLYSWASDKKWSKVLKYSYEYEYDDNGNITNMIDFECMELLTLLGQKVKHKKLTFVKV